MKKRPVVVSIIAVLLLINGILTLVNGYRFDAHMVVMILGAVALVLSLGMWMLWPWAWVGTVLLQIIAIGYALYDWFTGGPIDFLAMILGVIVLIYLLRSETRRYFFQKQPASADS
jgi:membrane-bound ClpP family serine protease